MLPNSKPTCRDYYKTTTTNASARLYLSSSNNNKNNKIQEQEMSESQDQAIKLFGRTIALPLPCAAACLFDEKGGGGGGEDKELSEKEGSPESKDQVHESQNSEERSEPSQAATASNGRKPSCENQESTAAVDAKAEERQNVTSDSQEKQALKKPDKILPCPRCNSLDTKFCYYNNYNVNQPRHFCKNCQRYWTAGGTMRNVPVGAGRRKNKSFATPNYSNLTISDATVKTLQSKVPESIHHSPLKPNGTVLTFGSDTPLCNSMANVLNGFHRTEEKMAPSPSKVLKNHNEQPTGSSATPSNCIVQRAGANLQQASTGNSQGLIPQFPCVNGSTWPYPWSLAPAFCASSTFAIPIYPAATYWGCTVPGTQSIPWISPPAAYPPNPGGSSGTAPTSPYLGKHSREGNILKNGNQEKGRKETSSKQSSHERCIWIPKSLRIDNPEEAAKSSIWAAMGIKNDKADTCSRGLFNAFQPKGEIKKHIAETSQALHANPAALSRSINFQESS